MIPITVAQTLPSRVAAVLHNIGQFDRAAFAAWCSTEPEDVQAVAAQRPPDRLYRVVHGAQYTLIVGIVVGYQRAHHGAPAMCMVRLLDGDSTIPLPAEALEDVTDTARAGQLSFLSAGKVNG